MHWVRMGGLYIKLKGFAPSLTFGFAYCACGSLFLYCLTIFPYIKKQMFKVNLLLCQICKKCNKIYSIYQNFICFILKYTMHPSNIQF